MPSQTSLRAALFAAAVSLLLPHAASAAWQAGDTTATVSSQPAARATGVSDPTPPQPGNVRIVVAPTGAGPGEQFGNAVASAGDVNGDGYDDVIVGAWTSDAAALDAGAAYIFFGGPGADAVPDLTLYGQANGDNFGTAVASAGDVNGDGFGDVIVGAWRSYAATMRTGRAYIYFGGTTPDPFVDLVLIGEALDDRFGVSVSTAGDLNVDGYSDVLVGAPGNDAGGAGAGRAYVYFGGIAPNAVADLVLTGAAAGDNFGYNVSTAGDLNGDGYNDVVAGAEQSGGTGRAYAYFGGPGLDSTPDLVFNGESAGDRFGLDVAPAGDVNGDGHADLIVSADKSDAGGQDAGRAYVFHGGPAADTVADLVLTGEAPGDGFGVSVAGAGDMNHDGFDDLIVGAWLWDLTDAGRAYIYLGGPAADDVPDVIRNGEAPYDRFGMGVAAAGDFDADGVADAIAGAYFNDSAAPDAGRAYVMAIGDLQPPVVTAPALVPGTAGSPMAFTVTAADPNGDAIAVLTAAPLPTGATFTVNGTRNSGLFSWTPGPQQLGTYTIRFTASNDLTGSATTRIEVTSGNHAPLLDPVADAVVSEGGAADQALSGSDPDGDALTFGLTFGPVFASVTTTGPTSGNLHLAPEFGDIGTYPTTVHATDGRGGTASRSLTITVNRGNRAPILTVPAGVFGAEGVSISLGISAIDPDRDHVTLGALNRPVGSLFVDLGNNSGTFSWTPGFGQSGSYTVTFTGVDAFGAAAAPRDLVIVVDNVNRGPTAFPGGPYAGVVNVPITFNGTGSSDPDGSPLSYVWSFGDLATGTGATPVHSYASGGTFTVTLTVDDGVLADAASTIATVQDIFPARAFASRSNGVIRLGSGKATWCAEIEPVGGSFLTTAVIPATVTMAFGTGQISALAEKVSLGGDKDANGIQELTACFSKTDLRVLFADLPHGTSTVTVRIEGGLNTGGSFRADLTIDVVNAGGGLSASVSPNPLNPRATLTFATSVPGRVRVTIFDLQGRLLRTLLEEENLPAAIHDVTIDGLGPGGARLASGVYFYRIEATEGVVTGRFAVMK